MNHSYPENFDHVDSSNPHSEYTNESTTSAQEVNSSQYQNIMGNKDQRLQDAIYKGPDVFGKVLGPTADESILVGLQALLDMAGGLEFTNFTPSPSAPETPMESNAQNRLGTSETVTQNSTSCQCSPFPEKNQIGPSKMNNITEKQFDLMSKNTSKDQNHQSNAEHPQIPQIITHEKIAGTEIPKKRKCKHSQTRVLPPSMICFDPERNDLLSNGSYMSLPCPHLNPTKFQPSFNCSLRRDAPTIKNTKRFSPPEYPSSCPCSQFYHETTTISVLANHPEDTPIYLTAKRMPCETIEQPTIILPKNISRTIEGSSSVFQEKHSTTTESTKETNSISIQTIPIPRPMTSNAKVETDSVESLGKSSVACDCNTCMPISAGVSMPPSVTSNVGKNGSTVRFADEAGLGCLYSICSEPKEESSDMPKSLPVKKNKSCSCSLIQKGVKVADAVISCLKVDTSCQFFKTQVTPIKSKSAQCSAILNGSEDSYCQICSESGDGRFHRKKSVRILGGPYECRDLSETRYCMESDRCMNKPALPLLDYSDEFSNVCIDKPARIRLEMGDSFIPKPMEVRYAITKITKFSDFSTFEIMKSTSKKPKCLPKAVEGVFVLKKEDYCSS